MTGSKIMSMKEILHFYTLPWLLCAALFFMSGAALPAFCADCYVDGHTGRDAGPGTASAPWKTISHALQRARGTDTVYIRCAIYVESLNLAPVPLRNVSLIGIAQGDSLPVISSADPDTHTISLMNYHGTIKGLEITGAVNANGINCMAMGGSNSADISECRIYGNNTGIHATTSADGSAESSPRIHHNAVFSNRSRGIGNMVYSSAVIQDNYIYANGDGSEGSGGIGNRDHSQAVITGNVIYGNNHTGIAVRDSSAPEIINNTVYGHDFPGTLSAGIRCNPAAGFHAPVILNNIIAYNAYGLLSRSQITGGENNYNDIYNNFIENYSGFEKGADDISEDPLFMDAQNNDFHLQAGSPCINTADASSAPDVDIDGIRRPQGSGCDMGAYEFSGQEIPEAPELAVTVSGLNVTLVWNQVDKPSDIMLFYAPSDISYVGSVDLGEVQPGITFELWHGAGFYVALKRCGGSGCSDLSNIVYFEIQ